MYMNILQMMHRLTTYFNVIVPVAVPIFWTDWGIYVVLTIMTTCLIINTIIATASYSEPTISKIMKTIMTRCEKFRIFETTSKSRKKMKIRTNRNCKYSRGTSTDKEGEHLANCLELSARRKEGRESVQRKSQFIINSTCVEHQIAVKEHKNLESSILTHTHSLLVWMIITLIAFATTLIYL